MWRDDDDAADEKEVRRITRLEKVPGCLRTLESPHKKPLGHKSVWDWDGTSVFCRSFHRTDKRNSTEPLSPIPLVFLEQNTEDTRTMIGNNKMLIFLALSIPDNCLCVNPSPGCSKPLPSIPRPGHSHNHPIQAGATSLLLSQYAGFRPFAGTRVSSIPHPPPAPLARYKQHCTASLGGLPGLDREHDWP